VRADDDDGVRLDAHDRADHRGQARLRTGFDPAESAPAAITDGLFGIAEEVMANPPVVASLRSRYR